MDTIINRTERTYVWSALSAARVPALMGAAPMGAAPMSAVPTFMTEQRDKCVLAAGGHGSFGHRGLIVDTDPIRSSPPPG